MINYELKHGDNFSYVENVFSRGQIQYLLDYWKTIEVGEVLIGSNEWDVLSPNKTSINTYLRDVVIVGIPIDKIPFLSNKIKDIFSMVVDYGFGIEGPHYFTYYNTNGFHSEHTDFGVHNNVLRDKVITIQLTDGDNYEGGDLIINGEVAPRDIGTFIIYSGNDPHEVTEVTRGNRYSITECAGEIK